MIVRRVVARDLPDVVEMARAFHAESPNHRDMTFDEAKVLDLVDHAATGDQWLAIVARNDADELVGMALMLAIEPYYSSDTEVVDLAFYVRPGSRNGRAAIGLMKEICSWAGAIGAKRLQMGIHTGINHDRALSFMLKCGFEPVGLVVSM